MIFHGIFIKPNAQLLFICDLLERNVLLHVLNVA